MSTLSVNTIQPTSGTTITIPSDLTVTGNITGNVSGSITNASTASYIAAANVVGTVTNAATASYVTTSQTASYVAAANVVGTVTNAATASYVTTSQTASYVAAANVVGTVTNAATASYVAALNQNVTISGSISVSGSLIPNTDGASTTSSFSLGSPTNAWKDIYVSNGTINFLDGAGNVQGTVGAGSAGTVITGSLNVISYGNEELNLENQGYTNGVFTQLPKQRLTSAGIKLAADYSSGLSLNAGLYTWFSDPILPWDKKITSFYVYNDLSSSMSPSLLYLPPIYNAPFIPGEIITVYNISPSASANIKNSGSLKISCFGQGILGVNTGSKSVTSVLNSQCPILSGSWGNYYSINSSFGYSSSLEILPGKKATFEVFNWGNFTVLTSSNYPFYNGDYSGNGYSESTYGAVYKLISVSNI
jgi:hypothetical protein